METCLLQIKVVSFIMSMLTQMAFPLRIFRRRFCLENKMLIWLYKMA